MTELVATVRSLIASWYHTDRIRVSPTTGRLLQLQKGDRLIFRGDSFCVTKRKAVARGDHISIEYHLSGSSGGCRLKISQSKNQTVTYGELIDAKAVHDVFEDEITLI